MLAPIPHFVLGGATTLDPSPLPGPGAEKPQPWLPLDEYLWHTCDIVADLVEGRADQRPLVPTMVSLAPGDRVLAVAQCERQTWRPVGDGSYATTDFVGFGHPVFVVGGMIASAVGNANARHQAEVAAQPRWVHDGFGELVVTTAKASFVHFRGPLDLHWTGLHTIDLVASDMVQISFVNDHDGMYVTVRLRTFWASLVLAVAALAAFPAHPRLLNGTWLPPDFEKRCADLGRPCRPAARLVRESRGT